MKISIRYNIFFFLLLTQVDILVSQPIPPNQPKNIIIMIADGWGYNQIMATDFYEGKSQKYKGFPVQYPICHFPAMTGSYNPDPTKNKLSWNSGYNSDYAWSDFEYVKHNYTESAAAATALACGVKTYNNAIGVDINKKPLVNITTQAKNLQKSAGVITSVELSHATPACFIAHNEWRKNYAEIARDMYLDSRVDVIMGAGHPLFDNNGKPTVEANYEYVGDSANYVTLVKGTEISFPIASNSGNNTVRDCNGDGEPDPWVYIETKQQFIDLANTETPPNRVFGLAQVAGTLQQSRTVDSANLDANKTPYNTNVPTLLDMTKGAINVLEQNPNGFFLMVEGGAVDWANHANQLGRMIEEMIDFNNSADYVINWIEANGGWSRNLLIICGDHETGYLTGPESNNNSPLTNPVIDNGKHKMPGARYNSSGHTNSLIPMFSKGIGSELFSLFADEQDSLHGSYLQNSEIAQVCFLLWGKTP